jgi:hypothetical protein
MSSRSLKVLFILAILALGAGSGYWWFRSRRQGGMSNVPPAASTAGPSAEGAAVQTAEQKKHLAETLKTLEANDRLNKQNNAPPNVNSSNPNNADAMKTLKDIQEINRINAQNRQTQQSKPVNQLPSNKQ